MIVAAEINAMDVEDEHEHQCGIYMVFETSEKSFTSMISARGVK